MVSAMVTAFDRDRDEKTFRRASRQVLTAFSEWLTGAASARQRNAATSISAGRRPEFLEAMADQKNFGMAKSLFGGAGLGQEDIDFDDPASIQQAMDRFDALPFAERKALTDPSFAPRQPPKMMLPDVVAPSVGSLPCSIGRSPPTCRWRSSPNVWRPDVSELADVLEALAKAHPGQGNRQGRTQIVDAAPQPDGQPPPREVAPVPDNEQVSQDV